MQKFAFKTLRSKYFLGPVLTLVSAYIITVIHFLNIPPKTIFPDFENYSYQSYTDSLIGGNSKVLNLLQTDTAIILKFKLEEGFQSPYVGLEIMPKVEEFISAGAYNQIDITIAGYDIDRIGIALYNEPSAFAQNNISDEVLYHYYLKISNKNKTFNIPVNELKLPEWWVDVHQISEMDKVMPDLDRIIHFNINTAYAPAIDKPKRIEISYIAFTRNNTYLFTVLGLLIGIFSVLLYSILFWQAKSKYKGQEITVNYKPVEIIEKDLGKYSCIDFINQNYSNTELTIDIIAKETGLQSRQITNLINEKFSCNFKTYLNRIRIHESKRLLKQTDLGIGEIAYKAGFNTQSHFNRVFKSIEGINPSDYKLQNSN